jgi:hypothetical protein
MALQDTISVVLRNNNSTLSTDRFEVYDNVEDAPLGTFTLKGGESIAIDIRADNAGKGSVKVRNPDAPENEWVETDSLAAGDIIA